MNALVPEPPARPHQPPRLMVARPRGVKFDYATCDAGIVTHSAVSGLDVQRV
jgi:hypothetical protein